MKRHSWRYLIVPIALSAMCIALAVAKAPLVNLE